MSIYDTPPWRGQVCDEQWTTNYEQWTISYELLAMNYELRTMNNEQWTMNYQLPAFVFWQTGGYFNISTNTSQQKSEKNSVFFTLGLSEDVQFSFCQKGSKARRNGGFWRLDTRFSMSSRPEDCQRQAGAERSGHERKAISIRSQMLRLRSAWQIEALFIRAKAAAFGFAHSLSWAKSKGITSDERRIRHGLTWRGLWPQPN
jgi:hypothetical protein